MDSVINNKPLISVLMPVYNCEMYIKDAVCSILNQTFKDFELLVIDDVSTDCTVDIIKGIKDSRIRFIEKKENTGLSNSLNLGLQLAKGKYIARMDGDDLSHPKRFEKQVAFLEQHDDIDLCGTCCRIIKTNQIRNLPESHDQIKLAFLKGNCMSHPSILFKKQILEDNNLSYDSHMEPAEDYDLWVRLASKCKLHNLQDVLLDYRIHNTQVSNKYSLKQRAKVVEVKHKLFSILELDLLPEEDLLLNKIKNDGQGITFSDIVVFKTLQQKLLVSNSKEFFEPKGFEKFVLELEKLIVKRCFITVNRFIPRTYINYLIVKRQLRFKLFLKDELKLIVKCLVCFRP